MKVLRNINPVYNVDVKITSDKDFFSKRISYLLTKQIKIKVQNEYNYTILLIVSKSKPLYLFDGYLFYKQGDKYFGLKKSKINNIIERICLI